MSKPPIIETNEFSVGDAVISYDSNECGSFHIVEHIFGDSLSFKDCHYWVDYRTCRKVTEGLEE